MVDISKQLLGVMSQLITGVHLILLDIIITRLYSLIAPASPHETALYPIHDQRGSTYPITSHYNHYIRHYFHIHIYIYPIVRAKSSTNMGIFHKKCWMDMDGISHLIARGYLVAHPTS
jgi:hypothetical protein